MGIYIGFEPVECAPGLNSLYKALLDQNGDISVHGAQTELRKFLFQIFIDPVRGRMGIGLSQHLQYPVSLPARSVSGFDQFLLINNRNDY